MVDLQTNYVFVGAANKKHYNDNMPIELIPLDQQIIRKKAEEKPKEEDILKVPKTRRIPKLPISISERKERPAGVPIVPGDACCSKVCETLNDKIDRMRDLLSFSVAIGGGKSLYKSTTFRTLTHGIEALEDYRQDIKEKGDCSCIEDTGAVSIIVPLLERPPRPGEEINAARGPRLVAPPTVRPSEALREKPIIPPTNSCCPTTCKVLNDEIEKARNIADNMLLRGGPAIYKNLRYEAYSTKADTLQDYRRELKDKNGCKCFE